MDHTISADCSNNKRQLVQRFAARLSGLACGLALAVRPAGLEGPARTMRGVPAPLAVASSRFSAYLA